MINKKDDLNLVLLSLLVLLYSYDVSLSNYFLKPDFRIHWDCYALGNLEKPIWKCCGFPSFWALELIVDVYYATYTVHYMFDIMEELMQIRKGKGIVDLHKSDSDFWYNFQMYQTSMKVTKWNYFVFHSGSVPPCKSKRPFVQMLAKAGKIVSLPTLKWVIDWDELKGQSVRKKPLLQKQLTAP